MMRRKYLLHALVVSSMTTNVQAGASGDSPALPMPTVSSRGTIVNAQRGSVPAFSAAYRTFGECIARSALESVNYAAAALRGRGGEPTKMDVACQREDRFNEAISVQREELQKYLDDLREKGHSADSYFKDVLSFFDKQGIYGLGIAAQCDPIAAPKSAFQLIEPAQALGNTPEDQQVSIEFDRVLDLCRITAGHESADVLVAPISSIAGLKKADKIRLPLPGEVSNPSKHLEASLNGVERSRFRRNALKAVFGDTGR
jgi:hypothetical protein